MRTSQLAVPLDDLLGAYFLTWEPRALDTSFLAPDSECRGACHRLLIRSEEAWRRRHEQEMLDAAARAISLLKQRGGDLVIRETRAGEIVVRREALGPVLAVTPPPPPVAPSPH